MQYHQSPRIDFVTIGSAKCGTTALHKYLNLHPDIYLPRGIGFNDETGLFLTNSNERIKALSSRSIRRNLDDDALFEAILEAYQGESIIGEETTDYTKRPYRTVRYDFMKSHNPRMKFLFLVRDPFQKLFSQYRHFLRYQPKDTLPDFKEEILNYDYYKHASAYFQQLEPYLEEFGPEQIKIVLLEELSRDSPGVLNNIFSYLGASEIDLEQSSLEPHKVNTEVPDLDLSLDDVPASIRDFIRRDMDKFQEFLARDLHSIWPNLAQT